MRYSTSFPNTGRASKLVLAAVLILVPGSLFAQDAPSASQPEKKTPPNTVKLEMQRPDYSKPKSHILNPIAPYAPREVSEPAFANTPRIDQMVREGKLALSLNDAIALALENNLDLAIARYNLSIADTDILRAKAGNSLRGVATGLVSGTPGGGVGGLGTGASGASAGGTAAGAGGAGAGTSGLVQSTLGAGPQVEQFDPSLSSTLQIEHATIPLSNTVTAGVSQLQQNTGTANFSYNQGFLTGTALSVNFNNNRQTTNSPRSFLNPTLNSNFRFTLRQHLLQGFGVANQLRFIRIARNNRRISDSSFRNQVTATVSQIQNIYWDLVNAYEDVKVKERSLALAQKTLSDNKKQVDIGTLAPIEIVRAESEVASRNQELIVSQTALQLQQTLIKNAISRTLSDPTLAAMPVIPSDTMTIPKDEPVTPVEDLIKEALEKRPEIEQSDIDLVNRGINKKAARNALLPTVDVFAFYGASGLAGEQNPLATCAANPCTAAEFQSGRTIPPGTLPRSGYGTTFGNLFDSSAPDKGVGMTINIPLRNRAAQADQVRSELEYRQSQLRLQQLKNTVGIEVRNAQFALQQNRARVEAAVKGRELAEQSLEAEQKKYQLGASTNFQVLQSQRDLALAESNLVTAMSAFEKSRVELDRVTGNTLSRNNISLGDAVVGAVVQMPMVPGLTPREAPLQ